jgi:hypothetical protein
VHVDVVQTLTGVDSSTFSDPSVQDAFRAGVALSIGNGVSSENVVITGYSDVVNSALALARSSKKNSEFISSGLLEHISRGLGSGKLAVSYSVIFNAVGLGNVGTASNLITAALVASITSGNFTKNLAVAASASGITTIYWAAPTDITSISMTILFPSPTATPSEEPTTAPTTKSSKKKADMALALGVGIGVGVPVLIIIIFVIYSMCGKSSSKTVVPLSA